MTWYQIIAVAGIIVLALIFKSLLHAYRYEQTRLERIRQRGLEDIYWDVYRELNAELAQRLYEERTGLSADTSRVIL